MKREATISCISSDVLSNARPVSIVEAGNPRMALYMTPNAFRISMTAERKAKVVKTRPG
jgi:hypothetical protein